MDPLSNFTLKFGQLDLDFNSTNQQTSIDQLPDLPLLIVFQLLNIQDVSSISMINRRFFRLTRNLIKVKKRHLVIQYGLDYSLCDLQNRTRLAASSSRQRRITSFDPIVVDNNELLSEKKRKLLKPVESLMLYTNNFYRLNPSFDISLLPNLKYLQSNDMEFSQHIIDSADRGLVLPKIEHLVLNSCPFDVVCKAFPNLVYLEVSEISLMIMFKCVIVPG